MKETNNSCRDPYDPNWARQAELYERENPETKLVTHNKVLSVSGNVVTVNFSKK